jgi:hypothetical protein
MSTTNGYLAIPAVMVALDKQSPDIAQVDENQQAAKRSVPESGCV